MASRKVARAKALEAYEELKRLHPDAHCELDHDSAFQLIVATALSAQTTDVAVNKVTPGLFKRYPTPQKLAKAKPESVEALINKIGMYRQKAKNIIALASRLVDEFDGEVPHSIEDMTSLAGVGRKTANVVMGVAFNDPQGVVVDTHVSRLAQRLGWSVQDAPLKIEQDLMKLLPQSEWDRVSHTLIFHGRRICSARAPACSTCGANELCRYAFKAEDIGRKKPKAK